MISLCAIGVPHTVEKLSTKVKILLKTSPQSKVCTQNYGPPKSWESHLGDLRQNDIWVLTSWPGRDNTIRGKAVVSPKSKSW
jgi:hypothetical protein